MRIGRITVLAMALPLVACGDDTTTTGGGNSGASCSGFTFSACGGNPVGTWKMDLACVPALLTGVACADTTSTSPITNVTATLNANGTYSISGTITGTGSMTLSKACLDSFATGYAQFFCTSMTDSDMTCSYANDKCTCAVIANETLNETGTYTTSGNDLMTTPTSGGVASTMSYCVQGSTLTTEDSDGLRARYTKQ
jgi:hypothetical protein